MSYVSGKKECLGLKTVKGRSPDDKRLLVYIHGDNSSGTNADRPFNDLLSQESRLSDLGNFTRIAIARPSHSFSTGVSSSGSECKKEICYTENNFIEIGNAIKKLKHHYGAKHLILVGRSGGGNTVASIAGLFPDLADEVVGIAGNYDFDQWVRTSSIMKPNWTIYPSPSAKDYVNSISKRTRFTLIHGQTDTNNRRQISESYMGSLKQIGISVELHDVPTGHFDQEKSAEFGTVLDSILKRSKAFSG
ncbi:MAG: alpha/beta hydrolase [Magnetospirillum sp.]|nr:alpha/beta hydrolase [Magnetospirillum sp.]